jgi:hypothetical protein
MEKLLFKIWFISEDLGCELKFGMLNFNNFIHRLRKSNKQANDIWAILEKI